MMSLNLFKINKTPLGQIKEIKNDYNDSDAVDDEFTYNIDLLCEYCNKIYYHRSSFSRHKKKCRYNPNNTQHLTINRAKSAILNIENESFLIFKIELVGNDLQTSKRLNINVSCFTDVVLSGYTITWSNFFRW